MRTDLDAALGPLDPLLARVAAVHGPADARLAEAHLAFRALRALLERDPPDPAAAAAAPLARLRLLTDGFTPPEHACRSYRRALGLLADLEDALLRRFAPGHRAPAARATTTP